MIFRTSSDSALPSLESCSSSIQFTILDSHVQLTFTLNRLQGRSTLDYIRHADTLDHMRHADTAVAGFWHSLRFSISHFGIFHHHQPSSHPKSGS